MTSPDHPDDRLRPDAAGDRTHPDNADESARPDTAADVTQEDRAGDGLRPDGGGEPRADGADVSPGREPAGTVGQSDVDDVAPPAERRESDAGAHAPEQATGPDGSIRPTPDPTRQQFVDPATFRRAPRFGRFIFLGVVLGALLSLALVLFTEPGELASSDLFLLLFLSLGLFGGLAGAVVAVILDRRSLRRRDRRASSAHATTPD